VINNPNRFYVYAYLRAEDSMDGAAYSPYYVGKGCGRRAFSGQRAIPRPKSKTLIVFIQEGLTELDALNLEVYCIGLYGRINNGTGILRNMTDGGEGCSGYVFSEKMKRNFSINRKGRKMSDEAKKNMSIARTGVTPTQATREKISQSNSRNKYELIASDGKIYVCMNLTVFGREHGLRRSALSNLVQGRRKTHKGWRGKILDGAMGNYSHAQSTLEKMRSSNIQYTYELQSPSGTIYTTTSTTQFAKEHNLSQPALSKVVRGLAAHHKGWTGRILEKLK
jgi:hypothetical protein